MKKLIVILLYILIIVIDGILIPSFRDAISGFGPAIFLTALLIGFGVNRGTIAWGLVIAGLTELLFGLYFGSMMGAWIITVGAWHLLNRFLSLKPFGENDSWLALVPAIFFGLILFGSFEMGQWLVIRLAYDRNLSIAIVKGIASSPEILTVAVGELSFLLIVIKQLCARRVTFYAQ